MNKGSIVLGVAAAVIGSGLFWAAGSKGDSGIAGWETLNVGMEQAVGIAESGDAPAAGGSEGGHQTKGNKQHLEKDAGQAEAAGNVEDGEKVKEAEQAEQAEQAVQTSADEKATAAAAGERAKGAGQTPTAEGQTPTGAEVQTPNIAGKQTSAGDKAVAAKEATELSASAASQEGKVNVNTAGVKELMDLPGIGEKKAQAIMDYRNLVGTFRSLSDLGKVKGIGPKILEKLKALVIF
ncbi:MULTISPECIES: ComEA family DNA-binding protein [Paenibacillus]|jgi:competence protein ComEA|uniref:ComEA family DNA-binding protein n=1 Tax=Paenibacillus TaxID=44249 RepID=UPI002DBA711E|nr:ComEA family DNA-binding protein [Paenibacillus odorifer]MEC0133823.1 ComEA family DNA-binding protein [Paenibacillus odorifer]MEC0221535.1 ComEA family DNA-binding protein [Paenibacillus odorifer]